jgi:hypothetical protein
MFLEAASPEQGGAELALRPGGWTLKLTEGVVKGSITAALLGTILAAVGFPALPALVLPAVFPILFDLEKVRLTKKEEVLVTLLALREEARAGQQPRQLYDLLPPGVREQLSFLDFADFLEKCRRAGVADLSPNQSVALRASDKAKFRVTIM